MNIASLLLFLQLAANPVVDGLLARVDHALLPPALKQTVRNAIVSGKVRDAEQALVNESARAPSDPEILTLASALFLADDQPLNCAISLKKVEKLRPLSGNEQFSLAMAYIAIKKPAWARAELQKLAVNSPADARYPYWLARISYDEARYEDAEQLLRKAISLDPAAARPYDNLGLNLEALGRLDEALTAYNTARELNRKIDHSPWPALNSGALALKMGGSRRSHHTRQQFRAGALPTWRLAGKIWRARPGDNRIAEGNKVRSALCRSLVGAVAITAQARRYHRRQRGTGAISKIKTTELSKCLNCAAY
jgi:tetratricopeptide (TPR) repeat protein